MSLEKKLLHARQFVAARNFTSALPLYEELVRQSPQGAGEYGSVAAMSGDFALADRIWRKFLEGPHQSAEILMRLGGEYQNIGMHTRARELFQQAAEAEPNNVNVQLKLASFLARTDSVAETRVVLDRVEKLDRQQEQGRFLSALLLRRENKFDLAEKQLRELIAAKPRLPAVAYSAHAELAYILDKLGRHAEAMSFLETGKEQVRAAFQLHKERQAFYERHAQEVQRILALPINILARWTAEYPPEKRSPAPPLAFLSGSARSGTTLLERILDAHPFIAACDEPVAFQSIQGAVDLAGVMPIPRLNALRSRYLKNLQKSLGDESEGKTLLDKNPSRTIWLPAFLRVFPELRVLIALRDPRDVMVSLYFQDHPMTNYLTFAELAKHYSDVMVVWLAVRKWEGLQWMETRYENVVENVQTEGERVTKFLGLEWNSNQAQFHDRNLEKPVMSTNYTDVTQPVYKRSVGRWKVYEKELAPVLPVLEPFCQKFGYT